MKLLGCAAVAGTQMTSNFIRSGLALFSCISMDKIICTRYSIRFDISF